MYKKAMFSSILNQVLQSIQSPPPSVVPFESSLPAIAEAKKYIPIFKIKAVNTTPPKSPQAIGYVSTQDKDKDGVVDSVNIVSPTIEEFFRKNFPNKNISNFKSLPGHELALFLNQVAETIIHEAAHLKKGPLKVDPNKPNFGMGTESEAEAAVPKPNMEAFKVKIDQEGSKVAAAVRKNIYKDSQQRLNTYKEIYTTAIVSNGKRPFGRD